MKIDDIIEQVLKLRHCETTSDEEYKELLTNLYWSAHYDGMVDKEYEDTCLTNGREPVTIGERTK